MRSYLLVFATILPILLFSQEKSTLIGKVLSFDDKEPLVGAKILIPELQIGSISNTEGIFNLELPHGQHTIQVSAVGFSDEKRTIFIRKDTTITFALKTIGKEFQEIVVVANQTENVSSANMGQIELKIEEIKKLPAFLGEVDLIKAIQLLPGVSSASEGGQGLYVRGGGPDQNLVLLDEAVIYNASHLFGFFSVFNPDAVQSVNLIKGGMPAHYGGRLSSVLEVNMNEGNNQKFGIKGGLGIVSSRLAIDGPLKKDKGSFMIAGRRTYVDLLMKAFIPKSSSFYGSGYYFYDLNFKANYKLSEKDHIYLSGYYGKDEFIYDNKKDNFMVKMPWQNGAASIRWKHLFGRKLIMNVAGTYSHYNFAFISNEDELNLKLSTGINDIGGKVDFTYLPTNPRHTIKFGAQYTHHIFMPSSVSAEQDTTIFDTGASQKLYSHETGLYLQDDWDITEKFRVHVGLRYSTFTHTGPFERSIKGNISQPDSSITYNKGDIVAFYQGLEPRFSLRYLLPQNSSIKAGFSYNYQYIHLASISAVSLPTDIWHPTTEVAKPQRGWLAAIGYFKNFKENQYEASIELYYKHMNNLVEFKEGSLPTDNVKDNTDNLLTFGRGWSYGTELFIRKNKGKFTGWVGYTWAKTERKFTELNEGKVFPAKYDRRHDLTIVGNYDLTKRWSFGAAFVFATGNTMTLPNAWYMHNQTLLFQYGDRNSTRMAPYHRMDLSVTWHMKDTKEKKDPATGELITVQKKIKSNWVFSIYNLYSRANPFFVYVDGEGSFTEGDFQVKVKQVSLFPIIPSLTWNFEF
ncbi:MAG TPA: TonB-dependent receptor [Taishania sp.]|nr:TonB-dependent receptor [Taishania sp.]